MDSTSGAMIGAGETHRHEVKTPDGLIAAVLSGSGPAVHEDPHRAQLCFPIEVDGKVEGALYIEVRPAHAALGPEGAEALAALAGECGRTIGRARGGALDGRAVDVPAAVRTLREVERDHIEAALAACHGRPVRAARALGISYTTLWRKMKAYGFRTVPHGRRST